MTLFEKVLAVFTAGSPDPYARALVAVIGVFGAYQLFKVLLTIVSFIQFFFRSANPKKYGEWAVVTGATDGIGQAYALELARRGMNIVLISRTQSRLDDTKAAISGKYPNVKVLTIAADFSVPHPDKTGPNIYADISKKLEGLQVGVLVNNVGMSYSHPEYLTNVDDDTVHQLLNINIHSTTFMTRALLPAMLERKRGAIVNISSVAGMLKSGDPLLTIYSATKAYVDFFSRSLELELQGKGVTVQCQVPYFVASKMSKIRNTSLTVPSPNAWARAAVAQIGYGASVVPFPAHALLVGTLQSLPLWLLRVLVLSHHKGIHKAALRKKERLAKEGKKAE